MKKRLFTFFMAMVLMVQSMLTNVSIVAWADSEKSTASSINITTVTVRNKAGQEIADGSAVALAEPIMVRYEFTLADTVKAGEELDLKLPGQIGIYTPLNFSIISEDGEKFAKVSAGVDGNVKIKLLEMAEHLTAMEGWFEIETFWKKSDIEDGQKEKLIFNLGETTKEITLNVNLSELDADVKVEKSGTLQSDNTILWTITVIPSTTPIQYAVRNIVVEDFIEEDQILDLDSCKVFPKTDAGKTQVFSRAAFGLTKVEKNPPVATGSDSDRIEASPSDSKRINPADFRIMEESDEEDADVCEDTELISLLNEEDSFRTASSLGLDIDERGLAEGFSYTADDPDKPRVLSYAFPTGISEPYVIQYKTSVDMEAADSGKFETTDSKTTYKLENKADVFFPKDAVGPLDGDNKGKNPSNTAEVKYPIEYVSKDGKIIDADSKVEWTVHVNRSQMHIKNAVIKDTFNPNETSKFLKLIEDSVTYEVGGSSIEVTKCPSPQSATVGGKSVSICQCSGGETHYTYDSADGVIYYALGDITEYGIFRYATEIDLDLYEAAGNPEIKNGIEIGGTGGWYGPGIPAIIEPAKDWISKKGIGYNPSNHQITWHVIINAALQDLKGAKFEDVLITDLNHVTAGGPNAQKYVDGTFKIISGGTGGSFQCVDGTGIQTLSYDFGDINTKYEIEFVTELLDPKDYETNITESNRRYKNTASLAATYHKRPITVSNDGYQEIISTVLTKKALSYDYITRVLIWEVGINQNKTLIKQAKLVDTLPEELEYVLVNPDGTVIAADGINIADAVQWNDGKSPVGAAISYSAPGTLTIDFGNASVTDTYGFTIATQIRADKYKELFKENNNKVTINNSVTLSGDGFSLVTVTAGRDVTNALLGKQAIYENGDDYVTWRVLINQHGQAIPLNSDAALNTVCLVDEMVKGLRLDVDSVKLYKLEDPVLSDNPYEELDSILKDSAKSTKMTTTFGKFDATANTVTGNICYSYDESGKSEFRFFLAPGSQDSFNISGNTVDNTILSGETYVLEFCTDIWPEMISTGAVNIQNRIRMEGAMEGESGTGESGDAFYSLGNGGGTGRKGAIKILKKDKYDASIKLEGAQFSLEDASVPHEPLYFPPVKATTDANGMALFPMLYYNLLYELKELSAPDEYVAIAYSGKVIVPETGKSGVEVEGDQIKLLKNGLSGGVLTLEVTNTPKLGWIEFRKKSETQDVYLNGAKFGVYYAEDCLWGKKDAQAKMDVSADGGVKAEKLTESRVNDAGWIKFDGLRCGKYYLKELEAPEGYACDKDKRIYFKIDPAKATEPGTESSAKGDIYTDATYATTDTGADSHIFTNTPVGNIPILKIEYGTTPAKPLKGAKFALYRSLGDAQGGTATPLKTGETGNDGRCEFTGISAGEYFLKETKPPENYDYQLDSTTAPIMIHKVELVSKFDSISGKEVLELYQYNKVDEISKPASPVDKITVENMPRGNFELTKKDVYNENLLSGAKINLKCTSLTYPTLDKPPFDQSTGLTVDTGSAGVASFTSLPYGIYTWEEVEAPAGYVKLDGYHDTPNELSSGTFTIGADSDTVKRYQTAELKNRPVLVNYQISKVDNDDVALGNVTFGLYWDEKYTKPVKEETSTAGTKPDRKFTSATDGNVLFDYLRRGTYYYREENKLEGYENTAKGSFTIDDSAVDKGTIPITPTSVKNWKTGNLAIEKKDSKTNSLISTSPAKFEIVAVEGDNSAVESTGDRAYKKQLETTGGKLSVELKVGWYRFRETDPPKGYTYLTGTDENTWTYFEVTHKSTNEKVVENRPIGTLEVTKKISNGEGVSGAPTTVEGAVFGLYYSNSVSDAVKLSEGTVGTTGTVTFSNFDLTNVVDNKVYLKEISVPAGYQLSQEVKEIILTPDTTGTAKAEFANEMTLAEIKIKKVDEDAAKNPVLGATIRLYKKADNKLIESVETGEDGYAVFKKIPYGTYYIKEFAAPEHYMLAEPDRTVEVTVADTDHGTTIILQETLENKRIGTIKIEKKDAQSGNALGGAKFKLYKKGTDGNYPSSEIKTGTTDAQGKLAFGELELGTYKCVETGIPSGYFSYVDDLEKEFTIDGTNFKMDHTWQLSNKPISAKLQVAKVSSKDAGAFLQGAEFKLQKEMEGIWVDQSGKITTDKNGLGTTGALTVGKYRLVETKAPEDYTIGVQAPYVEFEVPATYELPLISSEIPTINTGKVNSAAPTTPATVTNAPVGSFVLTKKDSVTKALLDGAEITLTNQTTGNEVGTVTTGAIGLSEGIAAFKDLPYGSYKWEETKAPYGYTMAVVHEGTFTIDSAGQKVEVTLENRPEPSFELIVTKTGEPGNRLLPGAEFTVFDKDGNEISRATTDSNGEASFKPLLSTLDDTDNYYFQETKAPKGYKLKDDKVWFHHKDDGVTDNAIIRKPVSNDLLKGSFKFKKTDSSLQANPLPGAVFKLTYKEPGTSGAENPLPDDKKVWQVTSDADGLVQFKDLPLGKYVCIEIQAPSGYHWERSWSYEIELTEAQPNVNYSDGSGNEIPMVNFGLYKGELEILKTDDTGVSLAGAVIGIFLKNNNQKIAEAISGSSGKVTFMDIYEGDYYYQEIEAPEGYYLNNEMYDFTIDTDGQVIQKTLVNKKILKGSFELLKVKSGTVEPLKGAVIAVYKQDGTLVAEKETGEDGILVFADLLLGSYYWEETKAPEGYVKDNSRHEFEVGHHEEVVKAVLENTKKSSGGGGGGGGSTPKPKPDGGKPDQNPEPGVPPTSPAVPTEPVVPGQPEVLPPAPPAPPVNPEGTPPTVSTTPNPDGSTTIQIPNIPSIPPKSEVAITDKEDEVVYRGRPDDDGNINASLVPGDYSLFILDDGGVPLAQMPFTILDEDVPLGVLPKTGDSGLPGALLIMIALGIFGTCSIPFVVETNKPVVWYRKKNKLMEKEN